MANADVQTPTYNIGISHLSDTSPNSQSSEDIFGDSVSDKGFASHGESAPLFWPSARTRRDTAQPARPPGGRAALSRSPQFIPKAQGSFFAPAAAASSQTFSYIFYPSFRTPAPRTSASATNTCATSIHTCPPCLIPAHVLPASARPPPLSLHVPPPTFRLQRLPLFSTGMTLSSPAAGLHRTACGSTSRK